MNMNIKCICMYIYYIYDIFNLRNQSHFTKQLKESHLYCCDEHFSTKDFSIYAFACKFHQNCHAAFGLRSISYFPCISSISGCSEIKKQPKNKQAHHIFVYCEKQPPGCNESSKRSCISFIPTLIIQWCSTSPCLKMQSKH